MTLQKGMGRKPSRRNTQKHIKGPRDVFIKLTKEQQIDKIREHYNLLLPETEGFIEPDENEKTYQITQEEIVSSVDITSATKHFDLKLNYGPYHVNYFRNGRQMLIGGKRGHVAAMDWVTKKLICEFNVMESVHDIKWLHMPVLFAVAQKDWVYIYDDKGTEMHCLKKLYQIKKMEFLPHHFLLATASEQGFLSWTDTSCGSLVAQYRPKKVRKIMCMANNPGNGVILTGHSNGVVSMWTPNSSEPAIQMLCHSGAMKDIEVSLIGHQMVTLGSDRNCKLWDIRMLKPFKSYKLQSIGECVDVSQRDMIAIGTGNIVQVFKNCWKSTTTEPYLRHKLPGFVMDLEFSSFEDVLGIGHENGFSSILVPGSGEPNFDTFESNPFMTTSQRKEMEVRMLLDKIPHELINVDPNILGKVNVDELRKSLAEKRKLKFVRVPKIEFKEKKTMKSVDKFKLKKRLKEDARRDQVKLLKRSEHGQRKGNQVKGDSKIKPGKVKGNNKIKGNRGKKAKQSNRVKSKAVNGPKASKGVRAVNRFLVEKGLKKKIKKVKTQPKIEFSNILDRFKAKK